MNQTAGDFSGLASSATTNSFGQFLNQIKPLRESTTQEDTLNVSAKVFNKTSNQASFVIYKESQDIEVINFTTPFNYTVPRDAIGVYIVDTSSIASEHPNMELGINEKSLSSTIAEVLVTTYAIGVGNDLEQKTEVIYRIKWIGFVPIELYAGDTLTIATYTALIPSFSGKFVLF
jgi:hypothetical protein